jgi:hypothetical protein
MSSDLQIVSTRGGVGGGIDLLDLPWDQGLADWPEEHLVRMAHGVSRHIVRFVRRDLRVYALKETGPVAARREYDALRRLRAEGLPVVEPVAVVSGLPTGNAILVTRYLDFSLPYWYVFGRDDTPTADSVLRDAAVVLLVRLHLEGVYWGDCSLSNILFRRDAGALSAYMVDAETVEHQPTISDGLRHNDLDVAYENIVGGLANLQAAGRVEPDTDVVALGQRFRERYLELWEELTRTDTVDVAQRWRIDRRIRHLNCLGFDVEELSIEASDEGRRLRITPVLVEEGHHSRDLRRRTGLEVQENQARRLLSDIANFGARLERDSQRSVPAAVAAARWLAEIYEPVVSAIPWSLGDRLEPPEFFHQFLEHRYLMAERLGREVPNREALEVFLDQVLEFRPEERQLLDAGEDPEGRELFGGPQE